MNFPFKIDAVATASCLGFYSMAPNRRSKTVASVIVIHILHRVRELRFLNVDADWGLEKKHFR